MPALAVLIRELGDRLEYENITIRVTQGLRTLEEQNALFDQGRILPGKIVTNAKGGESWHNFGCACDVAPFDDDIPDWNLGHPAWSRIVLVGQSLGLRSGVSWKDEPHFELTGPYPPDVPDEIRNLFASGGLEAVWAAVLK